MNMENDKTLYRFMKHIEFIRGYFKDGEWIGVLGPNHEKGITRQEAELLYQKECKKTKKYNSLIGRMKSAITQRAVIPLEDNYKTLLELMDIFHKDFIDEKDLDNILANAESFYNKYYLNRNLENNREINI